MGKDYLVDQKDKCDRQAVATLSQIDHLKQQICHEESHIAEETAQIELRRQNIRQYETELMKRRLLNKKYFNQARFYADMMKKNHLSAAKKLADEDLFSPEEFTDFCSRISLVAIEDLKIAMEKFSEQLRHHLNELYQKTLRSGDSAEKAELQAEYDIIGAQRTRLTQYLILI